ncbi:PepSY-associated TM helix domain-containing protein [Dechloromonas sp. ZY10]|uniref:PepSY-associated TM helix domain-containing protein n=1 Tax=Dechloromonas aquae TaxID=2664436 RepID=UPI003528242A
MLASPAIVPPSCLAFDQKARVAHWLRLDAGREFSVFGWLTVNSPDFPSASGTSSAHAALAGRSASLRLFLTIHWISSALCLVGMLLFAATGVTLNHAGTIEAQASIDRRQAVLPPSLLVELRTTLASANRQTALPPSVRAWLAGEWGLRGLTGIAAEWSPDEVYLPLPRPGGDAWLRLDPESGEIEYERSDRGWIAWANDLHKGRHTGDAWAWFIDLIAVGSLVFSFSGLWILHRHAAQRAATWPLVAAGAVLPLLIILLCFH